MENKKLSQAELLDKAMENYHFDVLKEFKRVGFAMFYQEIDGIEYNCQLVSENMVLLTDYLKDMDHYVGCGILKDYVCVFPEFFSEPISRKDFNSAKNVARELLK